ncbi:YbaK/EbsC family protein [Amnibacterium sp. CER49]|uniref:YbaK/EbsC family protein n=1 Tax=Amnibacterium sp. CER49 TaxID=3039161 RepID=UPI002448B583|nr:YbaK/EbsC family protein [Amnibacterium sp. CER49]MDH2444768.1 YbaK/EbsC family protein [Amnibacterium sp. CER49]
MTAFRLGSIEAVPARERPDLLGAPVAAFVAAHDLGERIGVLPIDPAISETAATQQRYALDPAALVNCVVVAGRREGDERVAACLVPSTKRADVNGVVKRRLDVRKASFLPQDDAVARSGMEYGGITPIGLPAGWPILLDADVVPQALVLVGSGIRGSKLLVPGAVLAALPGVEVVEGLGRPVA